MSMIPLMVNLNEVDVVIIGGGKIAERKVHTLMESGARMTVIAPEVTWNLYVWWKEEKIIWKKKTFSADDLNGAFLIIAATGDPDVDTAALQAAPKHTLCNDATNMDRGNVHIPAFLKRGKLSISISTGGASPMLAAQLKKQLETQFDDRYEQYLDFLYEARQLVKKSSLTVAEQKLLLKEWLKEEYRQAYKQKETIAWLQQLSEIG